MSTDASRPPVAGFEGPVEASGRCPVTGVPSRGVRPVAGAHIATAPGDRVTGREMWAVTCGGEVMVGRITWRGYGVSLISAHGVAHPVVVVHPVLVAFLVQFDQSETTRIESMRSPAD